MLRGMTARQFHEWRIYADLEPFDEERQDLRAASIAQAVANSNRSKKQAPLPLSKFILPRAGGVKQSDKKQTWQQQKSIALQYKAMQDELDAKAARRKGKK